MFEKKCIENIDFNYVLIDAPFRYDDEYLDSKLRIPASQENHLKYLEKFQKKDILPEQYYFEHPRLYLIVDVNTGEIKNYPELNITEDIEIKVCDEGMYSLMKDNELVATKNWYAPKFLGRCQEYGDYLLFKIKDNKITNWCFDQSLVSSFFNGEEE